MKSILVVGAHPDDESVFVAGTSALLASQGIQVHLLCATRGEGGELGEPPICDRAELGAVRERELRCAAQQIGMTSVNLLGYVDPLVGLDEELYPFKANLDQLAQQIRSVIRQVGAELVITHGSDGEYGHPAHQLVHQGTRLAVEQSSPNPLFYTFAARVPGMDDRTWNESEPAHLVLDVRPWLDAKEAAMLCHKTQHALFKRRRKAKTIREILRTTEAFHRHIPSVEDGYLQDPFADLLRAVGAWTPGVG